MASKPLDAQEGFRGGWNLNTTGLQPNQYALASNLRLVGNGELVPRQGTRRTHASTIDASVSAFSGFSWRKTDGTVKEILSVDGVPYAASYTDASLTAPALTPGSALAASVFTGRCSFASFRNAAGTERVYIADGTTTGGGKGLSYTDGVTVGNHSVGPTGIALTFIWVYNQRLFGVTGTDATLYFSALNDGDSLGVIADGGGFLTVRTYGGQQLTGGIAIGTVNVLFHRGAISLFRGTTADDIDIEAGALGLSGTIGVPVPYACALVGSVAYALTTDGVYRFTEAGMQPLDTMDRPDPLIHNTNSLPAGYLNNAGAAAWVLYNTRMKEVWFGGGSVIYVWSHLAQAWVGTFDLGTHPPLAIWESRVSGTTGYVQILYGAADGFVRALDFPTGSAIETYKDDVLSNGTGGASFSCTMKCRRFWGPDEQAHKAWRSLGVRGRLNGNATLVVTTTGPNSQTANQTLAQPTHIASADDAGYRATALPASSQYVDVSIAVDSSPAIRLTAIDVDGALVGDRGV